MKDWSGNNKSAYATLGASNHSEEERENNDYYATDPKALEIFLDKIKEDKLLLHKNIWECACGQGHLSKVLKDRGFEVWSTDLIDRGYGQSNLDFLLNVPYIWRGDILTNPPYKYAKEFVEKAMQVVKDNCYVIMFLKIQFLEGQARKELFKKYPPKYVYVNSKRQVCAKNGDFEKYSNGTGTAICYCWFVWQKGFTGEPIIRWI
jgi:hypothetical protein